MEFNFKIIALDGGSKSKKNPGKKTKSNVSRDDQSVRDSILNFIKETYSYSEIQNKINSKITNEEKEKLELRLKQMNKDKILNNPLGLTPEQYKVLSDSKLSKNDYKLKNVIEVLQANLNLVQIKYLIKKFIFEKKNYELFKYFDLDGEQLNKMNFDFQQLNEIPLTDLQIDKLNISEKEKSQLNSNKKKNYFDDRVLTIDEQIEKYNELKEENDNIESQSDLTEDQKNRIFSNKEEISELEKEIKKSYSREKRIEILEQKGLDKLGNRNLTEDENKELEELLNQDLPQTMQINKSIKNPKEKPKPEPKPNEKKASKSTYSREGSEFATEVRNWQELKIINLTNMTPDQYEKAMKQINRKFEDNTKKSTDEIEKIEERIKLVENSINRVSKNKKNFKKGLVQDLRVQLKQLNNLKTSMVSSKEIKEKLNTLKEDLKKVSNKLKEVNSNILRDSKYAIVPENVATDLNIKEGKIKEKEKVIQNIFEVEEGKSPDNRTNFKLKNLKKLETQKKLKILSNTNLDNKIEELEGKKIKLEKEKRRAEEDQKNKKNNILEIKSKINNKVIKSIQGMSQDKNQTNQITCKRSVERQINASPEDLIKTLKIEYGKLAYYRSELNDLKKYSKSIIYNSIAENDNFIGYKFDFNDILQNWGKITNDIPNNFEDGKSKTEIVKIVKEINLEIGKLKNLTDGNQLTSTLKNILRLVSDFSTEIYNFEEATLSQDLLNFSFTIELKLKETKGNLKYNFLEKLSEFKKEYYRLYSLKFCTQEELNQLGELARNLKRNINKISDGNSTVMENIRNEINNINNINKKKQKVSNTISKQKKKSNNPFSALESDSDSDIED